MVGGCARWKEADVEGMSISQAQRAASSEIRRGRDIDRVVSFQCLMQCRVYDAWIGNPVQQSKHTDMASEGDWKTKRHRLVISFQVGSKSTRLSG